MGRPGPFTLDSQVLGPLPVINHFLDRLGVLELLDEFVPHDDARLKLAPAAVLGVVVRNLVVGREPVYGLERWAGGFDPALLGLEAGQVGLLNDDRVGRMLTRLFDADRATLLTRLLLDAIERFDIDTSQLHTDSTSIKFTGAHATADGRGRGGKPTPKVTWGHSKDHRPDLKQLVWTLTVSADGAVPVCYRVDDGNTVDDVTHIPIWDGLVGLLGRADFLYVADCKLASRDNMDHIDRAGGRFVCVLPATRREDRAFRDWLADGHDPGWTHAHQRPARRHADPDDVWEVAASPWPSAEGYRIIWVRSSAKLARDTEARRDRIARAIHALDHLNQRLASTKSRIKTAIAAEQAATAALDAAGATRWIVFDIVEHTVETYRQAHAGRPGPNTDYRKHTRTHWRVAWHVRDDIVARDAASDGCFPLISNDPQLPGAELLAAYKWQPNLEKRHAQLKGTQLVAPVLLHDPARIEALLCCHFIAMLVQTLIERDARAAMATRRISDLALYPEDRASTAPTTARLLDAFTGVDRHHLLDTHGHVVQTFQPELTQLQRQILDLLNIPYTAYLTS